MLPLLAASYLCTTYLFARNIFYCMLIIDKVFSLHRFLMHTVLLVAFFLLLLFCQFFSPVHAAGFQTLDLRIMSSVFYHCATAAGCILLTLPFIILLDTFFLHRFLMHTVQSVAFFLLLPFCHFISPVQAAGFQTLDIRIKSPAFYYSATTTREY